MNKELEEIQTHVDPLETGLTELKDSFRRYLTKSQTAKYVIDFDERWTKHKHKEMRNIEPCKDQ